MRIRGIAVSRNYFSGVTSASRRAPIEGHLRTFHNYHDGESPADISLERSIAPQSSEEEDWEGEMQLQLQTHGATLRTYRSESEPGSITRLITL